MKSVPQLLLLTDHRDAERLQGNSSSQRRSSVLKVDTIYFKYRTRAAFGQDFVKSYFPALESNSEVQRLT